MSTAPEVQETNIQKALRDAFYAGLIALGLFVLLIGFKTDQNIRNELILLQRWGLLAIVVARNYGFPLHHVGLYCARNGCAKGRQGCRKSSFRRARKLV